jgi:hypothetical protein
MLFLKNLVKSQVKPVTSLVSKYINLSEVEKFFSVFLQYLESILEFF